MKMIPAIFLAALASMSHIVLSQRQCDMSISDQCPSVDPAPPKVLPIQDNCHAFCECSNGVAWYFDCPGHLVFDPDQGRCVYSEEYKCHTLTLSATPPPPCPPSVSEKCPRRDPPNPVYYPYPGDCHKFCECNSGTAYMKECQRGLVYNQTLHSCTWPRDTKCIE